MTNEACCSSCRFSPFINTIIDTNPAYSRNKVHSQGQIEECDSVSYIPLSFVTTLSYEIFKIQTQSSQQYP